MGGGGSATGGVRHATPRPRRQATNPAWFAPCRAAGTCCDDAHPCPLPRLDLHLRCPSPSSHSRPPHLHHPPKQGARPLWLPALPPPPPALRASHLQRPRRLGAPPARGASCCGDSRCCWVWAAWRVRLAGRTTCGWYGQGVAFVFGVRRQGRQGSAPHIRLPLCRAAPAAMPRACNAATTCDCTEAHAAAHSSTPSIHPPTHAQALKGPVRGLAPTHLVLNTGLWGPASQVGVKSGGGRAQGSRRGVGTPV